MTSESDSLDPERRLALSYVQGSGKGALEVLWRLDAAFAQLLSNSTQPIAIQMKLAWWREALIALDTRPAPAEPLLQAVKDHLLPAGLSGTELAELANGWEALVAHETLSSADFLTYSSSRGGALFHFSARLLGCDPIVGLEAAGVGWALVDLARHSSKAGEAKAAAEAAAPHLAEAPRHWPSRLRSLGMLAALARRDANAGGERLEPQASPGRMLRMLAHRLTGR